MNALIKGQRMQLVRELTAAGLRSRAAVELTNELLMIMQSPKDELLRTDHGEG
jgi:hypothetical protein